MNKQTIVINLFGGPGCGKSTCAAYIFSQLKILGINAELVTEFAKDKTWESNSKALSCQPYVFGKQCYRIDRCADSVDVIVTDSPLILSILYNTDERIEPEFTNMIVKKFNEYTNINFVLKRQKKYNPSGRTQTEEEARTLDTRTIDLLDKSDIEYQVIEGTSYGFNQILNVVTNFLKCSEVEGIINS